jgi:hypothetical protein
MRKSNGLVYFVLAIFVMNCYLNSASTVSAVTQTDLTNANNAIQSAFVSTYNAEKDGGNVSTLIAQLNIALMFVQTAAAENATDSILAATDIRIANQMAQNVSQEASTISQSAQTIRATLYARSIGTATAFGVAAVLIYIFGGRLFRLAWLRLYGNYVVERPNG